MDQGILLLFSISRGMDKPWGSKDKEESGTDTAPGVGGRRAGRQPLLCSPGAPRPRLTLSLLGCLCSLSLSQLGCCLWLWLVQVHGCLSFHCVNLPPFIYPRYCWWIVFYVCLFTRLWLHKVFHRFLLGEWWLSRWCEIMLEKLLSPYCGEMWKSGIFLKEFKIPPYGDTCVCMFIPVPLTMAKSWKQLACPLTNEWIKI